MMKFMGKKNQHTSGGVLSKRRGRFVLIMAIITACFVLAVSVVVIGVSVRTYRRQQQQRKEQTTPDDTDEAPLLRSSTSPTTTLLDGTDHYPDGFAPTDPSIDDRRSDGGHSRCCSAIATNDNDPFLNHGPATTQFRNE
jgi:cytoskeletal protein RodZ